MKIDNKGRDDRPNGVLSEVGGLVLVFFEFQNDLIL